MKAAKIIGIVLLSCALLFFLTGLVAGLFMDDESGPALVIAMGILSLVSAAFIIRIGLSMRSKSPASKSNEAPPIATSADLNMPDGQSNALEEPMRQASSPPRTVQAHPQKFGFFEGHQIQSVVVVSGHSKTRGGSAIARGVIGSAFLGPVGLLAAAGAKKNDIVTVIIHYKNGKAETKQMKTSSGEFKRLARYIH